MSQPIVYPTQEMKRTYRLTCKEVVAVLVIGDIALLLVSIIFALSAWQIYTPHSYTSFIPSYIALFCLMIPWLFFSLISDAYNPQNMTNLLRCLKQPIRTNLLVWIVYLVIYFVSPVGSRPRVVIVFFAIISSVLLIFWHFCHFHIFSRCAQYRRMILVGDDRINAWLRDLVGKDYMYNVVACFSFESFHSYKQIADYHIDEIVLTASLPSLREKIVPIIQCRQAGMSITPLPQFYERMWRRTPLEYQQWQDMLFQSNDWNNLHGILKRFVDIIFATIGAVIFLVIFPLLAVAIKLDSSGPLFFSQVRVGQNGSKFKIWKLRSMYDQVAKHGSLWTENDDQRVTRVGKILRKLHLDEFPQIWNIFKGEMSVVGVRPLCVEQCEKFEEAIPFHNLRHFVKPGLTSWAVVNYRHVNDLEGAKMRLEYDLYYTKYHSVWLDMLIICRTLWTMLTMNGL